MTVHEFGRTFIEVQGDDPISRYLQSELSCLPSAEEPAKIICRRVDTIPQSADLSHSFGKISLGDDGFRIDFGKWTSRLTVEDDNVLVEFAVNGRSRLSRYPETWQRFRNWNHLDVNEEIGKGVIYDVLDQAIQLQQLMAGQTFVHCSAIESDGHVDVIAGWGGAGKTSSVMDLVLNDKYRFLSDDLGIIDDCGTFYRSPKRIQIYPYNLVGSPSLEAGLLTGRGPVDRLSWSLRKARRGLKGVRRRVTAEEFFGSDNVAQKGSIRRFIHLERSTIEKPEWAGTSPEDMARRSSHVLVHELSPLNEVGSAFGAGNITSLFSTEHWRGLAEKHLTAALQGVTCVELRVPMATTPGELSDLLRSIES